MFHNGTYCFANFQLPVIRPGVIARFIRFSLFSTLKLRRSPHTNSRLSKLKTIYHIWLIFLSYCSWYKVINLKADSVSIDISSVSWQKSAIKNEVSLMVLVAFLGGNMAFPETLWITHLWKIASCLDLLTFCDLQILIIWLYNLKYWNVHDNRLSLRHQCDFRKHAETVNKDVLNLCPLS